MGQEENGLSRPVLIALPRERRDSQKVLYARTSIQKEETIHEEGVAIS